MPEDKTPTLSPEDYLQWADRYGTKAAELLNEARKAGGQTSDQFTSQAQVWAYRERTMVQAAHTAGDLTRWPTDTED